MGETEESQLERTGSVESVEQSKQSPAFQIPRVSARTLVGPANVLNQSALDWSATGLLAYGSNFTVVVIDTRNVQPVQTLDKHKTIVQRVCWEPISIESNGSALGLVSADAQGHIVVWDVEAGQPHGVMQDGSKPVLEMCWVRGQGASFLLAALHQPYSLILWDTRNLTRLWKKSYTETLLSFSVDPFDQSKIAFLCQDCILFVEDFSVGKIPSSNGRKFYISTPQSGGSTVPERTRGGGDTLRRLMKDLVLGETKPRPDDTMTVSECLQLCHHRSLRHHLLLLYPRELLVLDLHINQTVGVVPLDRSASPFTQVISSRQRDVLFCLHESGSVSIKLRKRAPLPTSSPLDPPPLNQEVMAGDAELSYEQKCQSEVMRLTKNSKILGMAADPVSETRIGLVLSSGKVVFLELGTSPLHVQSGQNLTSLLPPLMCDKESVLSPLRLQVTGLLSGVGGPLNTIRMCPALTTRNWHNYSPLMAGGTDSGTLQVYNMATGLLERELAIHTYPVRGIEWTSLKGFLTYAHGTPGTSGMVRNELAMTDILTGGSTQLRGDSGDEPPIDILRVSPLKQYFVLCLKFGTFELWDLRNLSILRTMPRKFPLVTALEWSPIHNLKALRRKLAHIEEKEQEESPVLTSPSPAPESGRTDSCDKTLVAREHFVFTDTESQLFHFSVEGNVMRDGIKIPPEAGVGGVTCIAFKNDLIVQGDSDGLLNIWDLKARSSRNVHTGRGWVKKMRFAPGKGNLRLLLLYNDGVDIIDLKKQQYERVSQLHSPRDIIKILDVDWAASDKPVLATQDGCLRVMDVALSVCSSPVSEYVFQDAVFCRGLMSPSALLSLRTSLSTALCSVHDLELLKGLTDTEMQVLRDQVCQLSETELATLQQDSIVNRALAAARMFGCSEEIDLWTIASYYLTTHKDTESREQSPSLDSACSLLDTQRTNLHPHLAPLDTCYDLLCDAYTYQRLQLERASLHESKRGDYTHTKHVIERLILLGQTDRAVQLLLETELDNPAYYTDAIKACLVATIQSTGAAQSTIKLVATNLIANGTIGEGVQLLCLIGKGLDACRYLTSYGMWSRAAWLAKSVLPSGERQEVLRKWAEHLANSGHKMAGVLVLLSLGRFTQAAEMLLSMGLASHAAVLLAACKEENIVVDALPGLQEELNLMFDSNQALLNLLQA